jgi:hypothetical protein
MILYAAIIRAVASFLRRNSHLRSPAVPLRHREILRELRLEIRAALRRLVPPERRLQFVDVKRLAALGQPRPQVVIERQFQARIEIADFVVNFAQPEYRHLADEILRHEFRERIIPAAPILVRADPAANRPVLTLNGYTYRSTIAAMGGPHCNPLRKSNREAGGLGGGA